VIHRADPEGPGGQPGDAAAEAFEAIRKERRGGAQQPSLWAAMSIVLILVGAIVAFAVISNRTISVPQTEYILDEPVLSSDDAGRLDTPDDLGSIPEVGPLVSWPEGQEPLRFEGNVTAVWFKRVGSCTSCWMNSRYWKQLFTRYWPSGLQVISVVDVEPASLAADRAIWPAAADPGGEAAAVVVGEGDVPENFVIVVDRNGHLRYAAPGKPAYDPIEEIVAWLLWAE
jgi:hypothetical protein